MLDINLKHNTFMAMNTRMDLVFWSHNHEFNFEILIGEIKNTVLRLEGILSRFDKEAETFVVNKNAYSEDVLISPTLRSIILDSIRYNEMSRGYFNIAYSGAKQKVENSFTLNDQYIRFKNPDVFLDFGGMGKGMALLQISTLLDKMKAENAFISFGGSSVLTRGRHPHGDYWPFTLEAFQSDESFHLNDDAISVSGYHEKGLEKKAHIVNPKTGLKRHQRSMVAVQSHCPVEAEVLSTALMIAPEEEQQSILKSFAVKRVLLH